MNPAEKEEKQTQSPDKQGTQRNNAGPEKLTRISIRV